MTVLAESPPAPPASRLRVGRPALLLGAVGAAVGFAGSWIPSYWGDEAASVMSARRSLPSLLAELSTIDGVHGVYYAFLHVWVSVFGASELSTRLPSAIAVGFMVAGTVLLVRMLATPRLAVLAGVVLILLPRTTVMGAEARSYALGAAAAVWITVLLVHLLRRRAPSRTGWVGYGIAAAAGVYLFLYLGLLLVVHAIVVLYLFRSQLRFWARGALTAAILSAPIVVVGYLQKGQIEFLARRDYATAFNVLVTQWFGSVPVAVACWALILLAVVVTAMRGRRRLPLLLLASAWLAVPTLTLLVGNAAVSPMYNARYLSFCTPAAAILVALGIAALLRFAARRYRAAVAAAAVVGLVALCAPVYVAQRGPFAKDSGSDLRQVAEYIGAHSSAGDAIVFDRATKPSRDPRLALRLYPSNFTAVDDVGLLTAYDDTSGIWDITAALDSVDLSATTNVWAVELGHGSGLPPDVTLLQARGFTLESATLINRTTIYRLTKE